MFWLHGGGFGVGSSFEFPSYDGRNLARRGDVVVVSVNHRLNAFGFLISLITAIDTRIPSTSECSTSRHR